MIIRWFVLAITLLLNLAHCLRFETEIIKDNIEQGRLKYHEYKAVSSNEKVGVCWASAILDLEKSCENLNEEATARLAYAFLTCHLQQHRRKIHVCADTATIESCTETLTDTMFGIYTSFVMHTHNMCFYLQSANWQNKLDSTVDRLQDNSDQVADKLEIQGNKQEHLLLGMHAMSDMNTDILTKTEKLQRFIARLFNLVEKIGYIQQAFYDHFTTYEMILFYAGSIIVTLISTSFSGVSQARPAMLCITAVSLAVEQAVLQYGFLIIQDDELSRYRVQKQLRRVWLAFCIGKWVKTLYSSTSPDEATRQILNQTRETKKLVQDLKHQISPIRAAYKTSWFSDDDTLTSEHATQTDGELSPFIIKPKKYSKKKSLSPPKTVGRNAKSPVTPGRSGTGRYNLRPITPQHAAPLAPPITWPGFSSDDADDDYVPRLEVNEI